MWPPGGDDHPNEPDKRFVQIKIPVEAEVDNWWNYDAEIWLWFYLYIGANFFGGGNLKGYLAYYGAWVEGGIFTDDVLDGIMNALQKKVGEIDSQLDSLLSQINVFAPFTAVYLLPGNQEQFNGTYMEGHVEDNVSMVLVKKQPPVVLGQVSSTGLF